MAGSWRMIDEAVGWGEVAATLHKIEARGEWRKHVSGRQVECSKRVSGLSAERAVPWTVSLRVHGGQTLDRATAA